MVATLVTTSLLMFSAPAVVDVKGDRATSCCALNFFNIRICARVWLSGPIISIPVAAKAKGVLVHAASTGNLNELWEDPNQVSDNEDKDEEAEAEENDFNFESDWDADKGSVKISNRIAELSASNYEEDLIKGL